MSNRYLPLVVCASLLSACAATGGDAPASEDTARAKADDEPEAEEPPPAKLSINVAIASVQMIQDCPDPPEPSPAAGAPASQPEPMPPAADQERAPAQGAARKAGPGGGSFAQPCDQSTVQLTIKVEGETPQTMRIAAIRLLDSNGKSVGELSSRKPTAWVDQGYAPWDQTLTPGAELKASYKLGLPDWSAVETAIGGTSFGPMFKLEVDVEIGGELTTVQSPEFPREQPHVIVT